MVWIREATAMAMGASVLPPSQDMARDEQAAGSPPEPGTAPGHQGLTRTPCEPRLPFSAHAK